MSAIDSVRRPGPGQRVGPWAGRRPSWASTDSAGGTSAGGAEVKTDGSSTVSAVAAAAASRARSLATVRIRSAVLPISTTPAPSAISQPVVPFWVTCTSSWMGTPTRRSVSVSSWAVTGTMPLARAVTSASTVTLS